MLTPSELRDAGLAARCVAEYFKKDLDAPVERDDLYGRLFTIADLCEQVAELRENEQRRREASKSLAELADMEGRFTPRTLKASEITEPGWYIFREPDEPWNWKGITLFSRRVMAMNDEREFYGPIQLPE